MSTPTLLFMLAFMGLISAAMVVAYRHMMALRKYTAAVPEMKATVSALNAAILNAEATLARFRGITDEAAPAKHHIAPPQPRHMSRSVSRQARPASSLAALVDAAARQQDQQ